VASERACRKSAKGTCMGLSPRTSQATFFGFAIAMAASSSCFLASSGVIKSEVGAGWPSERTSPPAKTKCPMRRCRKEIRKTDCRPQLTPS